MESRDNVINGHKNIAHFRPKQNKTKQKLRQTDDNVKKRLRASYWNFTFESNSFLCSMDTHQICCYFFEYSMLKGFWNSMWITYIIRRHRPSSDTLFIRFSICFYIFAFFLVILYVLHRSLVLKWYKISIVLLSHIWSARPSCEMVLFDDYFICVYTLVINNIK